MMVLGIGGCTALLVTGFGLKDSLTCVIDEQFEKITFFDFSVNFREEPTAEELAACAVTGLNIVGSRGRKASLSIIHSSVRRGSSATG